jgi:hypothetical protein
MFGYTCENVASIVEEEKNVATNNDVEKTKRGFDVWRSRKITK